MATLAQDPVEPFVADESSARTVWRLAWPAVALNSMQVINTLLDRGFIGHLNTAALTAHGASMNVLFLMFSLAVSIATGATALVSRFFGAGEPSQFRLASRQSVSLAIAAGFMMGVLSWTSAAGVAHALLPVGDTEAAAQMTLFVRMFSLSLPALFVIQTLAGCMRGVGDTVSPMIISSVQILLHISFNLVFIFPPRIIGGLPIPGLGMGLPGAAAALALSAWISAFGYLIYSGRTPLGEQWKISVPSQDWTLRILKIAVPAALMSTLRVLSLTMFTLVLAMTPGGSVAIAAMGVGFSVESIMFMPFFGLSAAAGALVGQSLGMKNPARAERLAWKAAHHGGLVTLGLAGPIFIFCPAIAGALLAHKADVVEVTVALIRSLCLSEVLFAYAMILVGAMQGAGDTTRPMWITLFALWGLRVPLAFAFALPVGQHIFGGVTMPFGLGWGSNGAWIALSITQGIQGILAMYFFKQGAWKLKKV